MKVAIIGSGYVGLVSGVCLAAAGHDVVCVDRDEQRVGDINRSVAPFFEPGLDELLDRTIHAGTFRATADLSSAIEPAAVVMVAVGTPSGEGRIDLAALKGALTEIGEALAKNDDVKTVVIKSTVIPGTTDTFAADILERSSGKSGGSGFGLAMNPEFLREGSAIDDFSNPDRIVLGTCDERSLSVLEELYVSYPCPKIRTTPRNAELIKYTSNALLATLISFSNEISAICESVEDTDVDSVMDALHLDRRLSPTVDGVLIRPEILTYLRAGAGFGGSCLPKDAEALTHFASEAGAPMEVLSAALSVNTRRAGRLVAMLRRELGDFAKRRIVLLGIAFKPGTNDVRESAALRVADILLSEDAEVWAMDPVATRYSGESIDDRIWLSSDPAETFRGAHAAVLLTAWPEFKQWDWGALMGSMSVPYILDCRNALREQIWPPGTIYRAIGRTYRQGQPVTADG